MLEQQVADLLAREAIRDLPLRYCDCVWRDDIDGIVALFTTAGSFTVLIADTETKVEGHDALREFYAGAMDLMPRPYIHNHVVDLVADDIATGRCYLDLRSARNNMDWLGAGYYEDAYRATTDGWKFASRRFYVVHMTELPEALGGD